MDEKKLPVLILLHLSAAFDAVDHSILLNKLHSPVDLSGTAFKWFNHILLREFFVSMDKYSSNKHKINGGVPQGSV